MPCGIPIFCGFMRVFCVSTNLFQLFECLAHVACLAEDGVEVFDLHALLSHGVAMADSHAVVVQCVMIHSDTERCTNSILTTVAFANRILFVVVGVEIILEHIHDLTRFLWQTIFLYEWHDACFHRSQYSR